MELCWRLPGYSCRLTSVHRRWFCAEHFQATADAAAIENKILKLTDWCLCQRQRLQMSVVIRYMHTGSSNRLQGYYAPLGGLPSGASFHLNIGGKVSPGTQPKDAGRVGVDKGVGRSRENFKNLYPNFICILEYFYYKEGFNLSHLASTGLALWRNYLPPHTTHRWGQLLPTLLTQMTLLLAVTKLIYLQPIRRPTVHYSQTVVI